MQEPIMMYAIREAVALLRASRRNFKSRQVEQVRDLLEKCLEDLPDRPRKPIEATCRTEEP